MVAFKLRSRDAGVRRRRSRSPPGWLFGLFPALHSTRPDLATTLKNQAGQPVGRAAARRFRATLATVQIALSMALLVPAGLFAKSLVNVSRVDLGLKTDHLVTFCGGADAERLRHAARRAPCSKRHGRRAGGAAGRHERGVSMVPVLAGNNWNNSVAVEGFEAGPDTNTIVGLQQRRARASSGRMGMPLMARPRVHPGRRRWRAQGGHRQRGVHAEVQPRRRRRRQAHAAVGAATAPLDIEIVGVVQDAKYSDVKRPMPAQYFTPYRQMESLGFGYFYVRTASSNPSSC